MIEKLGDKMIAANKFIVHVILHDIYFWLIICRLYQLLTGRWSRHDILDFIKPFDLIALARTPGICSQVYQL